MSLEKLIHSLIFSKGIDLSVLLKAHSPIDVHDAIVDLIDVYLVIDDHYRITLKVVGIWWSPLLLR